MKPAESDDLGDGVEIGHTTSLLYYIRHYIDDGEKITWMEAFGSKRPIEIQDKKVIY